MKKIKIIGIGVIFLVVTFSNVTWAGPADTEAIEKELRELKARIAEVESLKGKLDALENKVAESKSRPDPDNTADEKEELDEADIKVGGAFRFNYAYKDFQGPSRDKGGDFIFDHFRLNMDVVYKDLILSTQYRYFGYMHIVHHAWMGYNFNDSLQGQVGLMKVPFGILPYADHSYWLGAHYYMGLSDEYDLGFKFILDNAPWDIQFAFFKNADWGDSSNKDRYSTDVVTDLNMNQANEETNQLNLRIARTFDHGNSNKTEIGVSGMVGQLYNSITKNMGDRWAAAAHLNGFYGPFNLMLEGAWYGFNPENPVGVDDNTVLMANYGSAYLLASEGVLLTANVSYDVPVAWGPITKLTFFNDYNILIKDIAGFSDTQMNVPGVVISAGPMLIYVEALMGKNMIFLGDETDPMGAGSPNAEWNIRYNISIGYYF